MQANQRPGSAPAKGAVVLLVAIVGVATFVATKLVSAPSHRKGAVTPDENASQSSADDRSDRSSSVREAEHRTQLPASATFEGERQRSERQRRVQTLVGGLRLHRLNMAPRPDDMGIEAVDNSMVPSLQGALATLTAVNPAAIDDLRDVVASQTCDHPSEDIRLRVRNRKKEALVLWTMLDAWKAAGRPDIASISKLTAEAADPRTLRRLSADDPIEQQRLAALQNRQS